MINLRFIFKNLKSFNTVLFRFFQHSLSDIADNFSTMDHRNDFWSIVHFLIMEISQEDQYVSVFTNHRCVRKRNS